MPTKKQPAAASRPGRRPELLAIAAEVFAARGYDATTVREIADEAGMLAGSLYHHFASKEAMADEILSTFLTGLRTSYDTVLGSGIGTRETLEALVTETFRHIGRHRAAAAIYRTEAAHLATRPGFHHLAGARAAVEDPWLRTLERGAADGTLRPGPDPRLTARFIGDAVWGAASWAGPDAEHDPAGLARPYLALLLDGLAPRG
ncbi:TetR/AcrR family transcriptional regulator [Streptomyces sp. NBC_00059]|uniref:TetR/AcrR family transcriptional regulator n=1 Tax=Streptomyces sp. NBC_00059 TaxID=2975635 RepID=UPI0022530139|nr:TetR/AcrR family transcriptional regulator [Streptomyces sp. NBC_00059]MCX5413237.1 TetR/AcrR family transcriptional regulator [Streptomyces sp. NBC_00059]